MRFPARFPWRFGGADTTADVEHRTLLDALAPGWDVSEGTGAYIESRADALAVSMIWTINRRLAGQLIPTRMLDNLPGWERACNLRPAASDTTKDRRAALAAKLRGLANNALVDIDEAVRACTGTSFLAITVAAAADWVAYWPGVNPGPPGYEWASNRAQLGVHLAKAGLSEARFTRLRSVLLRLLEDMLPGWTCYVVGVGTGTGTTHVCGAGLLGQTVI